MRYYFLFFVLCVIKFNAQCTIPNHVVKMGYATAQVENGLTFSDLGNGKYSINGTIANYYQGLRLNIKVQYDKEYSFAGTKIYEYYGSGKLNGNSKRFLIESMIKLSDLSKCSGYVNSKSTSYTDYEVKFYYWDSRINEPLMKEHIEVYPINYIDENNSQNISLVKNDSENRDEKPFLKKTVDIGQKRYLVSVFGDSDYNQNLILIKTYKESGKSWQIKDELFIENTEFGNYINSSLLDVYEINDKKYIYLEFTTFDPEVSWGNYNFGLFDIKNNDLLTLTYYSQGTNSSGQLIDGDFSYYQLEDKPEILKLLEYKASTSNVIYSLDDKIVDENNSFLEQYKEK